VKRSMGKKGNSKTEEDIDKLLEEHADIGADVTPSAQWIFYIVMAFVTSSIPIYLYLTPMFDLTVEEHGVMFALVTLISTGCLAVSYNQIAVAKKVNLLQKRDLVDLTKTENLGGLRTATATEAIAYSLFVNNAVYLAIFLFIGFYVCSKSTFGVTANYVMAVLIPAVLIRTTSV